MNYKFLLFDADNTILDFDKAEETALQQAMEKAGLHFDEHVLQVYKSNNMYMWHQLELGLCTKEQVLEERFLRTQKELGLQCDIMQVAHDYEEFLHHGFFVVENAENVLQQLAERGHQLYLVTNGVLSISTARMIGSGLAKYFHKRFVSEEIGTPKPQIGFFNACFEQIEGFNKSQAIIIGDSLSSDIQGGINAGIDTCWYNPRHLPNKNNLSITYQIDNLLQLLDIL